MAVSTSEGQKPTWALCKGALARCSRVFSIGSQGMIPTTPTLTARTRIVHAPSDFERAPSCLTKT
ncbi:hypothetical protein OH76DRAFT_1404897, partial [Lentinus brumalis]